MLRRTFLAALAALFAAPAIARVGIKPAPKTAEIFVSIGPTQQFRIAVQQIPREGQQQWAMPIGLLAQADYIAFVEGKVVKDRWNMVTPVSFDYMLSTPLLNNEDLVAMGFRPRNETFTPITRGWYDRGIGV